MSSIDQKYEESEKLLFNEYCDVKNLQDRHQACQMMQFYLDELHLDISKLKYVHVTGSKGKGTTCAYVESALRRHGLKTALFTSPHIQTMCERFRINGKMISKETYLKHFDIVWSKLQEIKHRPDSERPAYITRWPDEDVDVVILEVGMGGRLDSTNVIKSPITTGITLIDLEHTEILGTTYEQIATEKGGIFKENAPAVVMKQQECVLQSLQQCAKEANCTMQVVSSTELPNELLTDLPENFPSYLLENFTVANQLVANVLSSFGIPKNDTETLLNTHVAARSQILEISTTNSKTLKFMIDGGHTPRSMKEVCKWITNSKEKEITLLFYCGRDKNSRSLIQQLVKLPLHDVIFTMVMHPKPEYTKVEIPTIEEIKKEEGIKENECKVEVCENQFNGSEWLSYLANVWRIEEIKEKKQPITIRFCKNAIDVVELLKNESTEDRTVCCTGSLYLCGDVLNAVNYHNFD